MKRKRHTENSNQLINKKTHFGIVNVTAKFRFTQTFFSTSCKKW